MTTAPRKMNSHKKARAICSGFLAMISIFALTPRQGLATTLMSVVRNHIKDNSITVCEIAHVQADNSTSVCFLASSQAGGV